MYIHLQTKLHNYQSKPPKSHPPEQPKEIEFWKSHGYEQLSFPSTPELGLYSIQRTQNYGGFIQPCIVCWGTANSIGGVRT